MEHWKEEIKAAHVVGYFLCVCVALSLAAIAKDGDEGVGVRLLQAFSAAIVGAAGAYLIMA